MGTRLGLSVSETIRSQCEAVCRFAIKEELEAEFDVGNRKMRGAAYRGRCGRANERLVGRCRLFLSKAVGATDTDGRKLLNPGS